MKGEKQTRTGQYLRLQLPSHPRYLATIRNLFYQLSLVHGFSPQGAFEIKIITGEVLTNIIKHAYDNKNDRPIFIEFYMYPDHAELRFRDLGKRRPVGSDLVRDLSDYRESGLGLYLIGRLSDYHFFNQSQKVGTELVVKKKIG